MNYKAFSFANENWSPKRIKYFKELINGRNQTSLIPHENEATVAQ